MPLERIIEPHCASTQSNQEYLLRVQLEPLAWESEFFARKCARFVLDSQGVSQAQIEFTDFDIVQSKIPANRLDLLDQLVKLGFQFVEGEADFSLPINALADTQNYRIASELDILAIRAVAKGLFAASRFRAPWYTEEERDRFYQVWAENAVRGLFDHACLVIEDTSGIHGFVTLRKLTHDAARIGLLAVRPDLTGRGLGKVLIKAARHWCAARNVKQLSVATQISNLSAMSLYIASGAQLAGISYWLYK